MEQITVGDLTLTWLNGGVIHMDGGAVFGVVPKPLWSKKYLCNEKNQIELCTDPILIQVEGKNILLETGIGNNKFSDKQIRNYGITSESKLSSDLNRLGLSTSDIDYVLMTHMHFDHACGIAKWEGDNLVPTFEHATIIVNEIEWEELKKPNFRSRNTYWEENWSPILDKVQTFNGMLEVFPGIEIHHTGGHSDGHSIVLIKRNGECFIHMADLMPTHAHSNPLWVSAYDDYPMISIAEKQKWLEKGLDEGSWFIFYHDNKYRALKWNKEGEIISEVLRNQSIKIKET
ncbi:hypothetical protein BKP45_11510 [Anaerobacillus alkalidiazotrophicus]|uniref:Metallo-beta-lactamase domain-containing protein n=1 Tax=Anaerobacillus alkalidiazotrophicus TaxID=472963 RepID=A0A1S2M3K5_9BACI|nr:MBL fold metallo-hydrolase [Anaerobacillus alkalidiazotrophicus]OIJ18205.1 hypothetical protein BKP45_17225 [Anaerobacillus alkalidiazotrophicus]OIJ19684.1 hypothetical protein BKP45_11510 [Anaerobacillus alkalidiazotrophicus]